MVATRKKSAAKAQDPVDETVPIKAEEESVVAATESAASNPPAEPTVSVKAEDAPAKAQKNNKDKKAERRQKKKNRKQRKAEEAKRMAVSRSISRAHVSTTFQLTVFNWTIRNGEKNPSRQTNWMTSRSSTWLRIWTSAI